MENTRKILNLSGAGTKISGLAGACDYIFNVCGYRPTDISGISSGGILAIPIALRTKRRNFNSCKKVSRI